MFSRTQLLVAHAEKRMSTAGNTTAVRLIALIGNSPSRFDEGVSGVCVAAIWSKNHTRQQTAKRHSSSRLASAQLGNAFEFLLQACSEDRRRIEVAMYGLHAEDVVLGGDAVKT